MDVDAQDIGDTAEKTRQPSVEEIPDDGDRVQRQLAGQSLLDESLHPSRSSSIPPHVSTAPSSTIPAPAPAPVPKTPSPAQNMDVDNENEPGLSLPSAPETIAPPPSVPHLPDTPDRPSLSPPRPSHPEGFHSFPPPSTNPPSSPPAASHDPTSFYNRPTAPPGPTPVVKPAPAPAIPAVPAPAPVPGQATSQAVDDQAIASAQKHARWAVSALTFDDVNTAINELRNSLRCLGAG